jgi:hypothetical protein
MPMNKARKGEGKKSTFLRFKAGRRERERTTKDPRKKTSRMELAERRERARLAKSVFV